MLDNVYNSKILEYAGTIGRVGRLDNPHASSKKHSKLCGSTVIVDLKVDSGKVVDFAHEVKACALGQASSSMMSNHVIGSDFAELRNLREKVLAMLKQGGEPPDGKFAEFKYLEPVKDFKARHASTMLTFDAVVDCLDQIENELQSAS